MIESPASRFRDWVRPFHVWRYETMIAKIDAVIEAQKIALGNALLPSLRDLAQTIATTTGARTAAHMAQSVRIARQLRRGKRWPGRRR